MAALLRTLLAEGQDEQAIELVVGLLSQLMEKNTELELRLRKAMRQHFGRTSEKLSGEQLSLWLESLFDEDLHARRMPVWACSSLAGHWPGLEERMASMA